MARTLGDVTRDFGRGEATLETLRAAARAEGRDRKLAEQVLKAITDWESSGLTHTVRARTDLRMSVKALVPPAASAPPSPAERRRASGNSLYEPGLRGQRRRS